MKSVLCRGPVLTQSGYGVHTRQIARWLLKRHDVNVSFQALPWGITPWILDKSRHNGLIDEIMKRTVDPNQEYDITLQLQLPNEWDNRLGKFNVGITAAVETDRCNPEWLVACNKMNLVIVPSEHCKMNLQSCGQSTTPIVVVPEAFSDSCANDSLQSITIGDFSTSFNFLVFGQLTGDNPLNDRKNTFNTLKWLFEEFANDKDVGVILKTNSGKNTLIDKNVTLNTIGRIVKEVRKTPFPRLHLLHGDMPDDDVANLYRHHQVKALVAATRGEGFGLPILEAAASGLPVIATDWSGHTDFLRKGKFIDVQYQLSHVHKSRIDGKIFVEGSRWAEPLEKDFKKRVSKFRTSPTIPTEWAKDLSKKLLLTHNFEAISKQYDDVFKDII